MESIVVNGVTYYANKQSEFDGLLKIVVLQRGWVLIGRFEREENLCKLHNASVIRIWGTTKGLGELASDGPTSSTKIDKCFGVVEFDFLTMVFSLSADESKWKTL